MRRKYKPTSVQEWLSDNKSCSTSRVAIGFKLDTAIGLKGFGMDVIKRELENIDRTGLDITVYEKKGSEILSYDLSKFNGKFWEVEKGRVCPAGDFFRNANGWYNLSIVFSDDTLWVHDNGKGHFIPSLWVYVQSRRKLKVHESVPGAIMRLNSKKDGLEYFRECGIF